MRHFGHGIGHLQYERQHEVEPEMAVDDYGDMEDDDMAGSDKENIESGLGVDAEETDEEDENDGDDVSESDSEVTDDDHDLEELDDPDSDA